MRTVDRPERPYLGQKELDDLMRMNSELLAEQNKKKRTTKIKYKSNLSTIKR